MSKPVTTITRTRVRADKSAVYGLVTAVFGMLLVLSDGMIALAMNSALAPSIGGAAGVGWSEIALSLFSFIILYFYRDHSTAVASTVGVLAAMTYGVDGGFYYAGATIALIGAILIYFRR